jgi:hypothetical protein
MITNSTNINTASNMASIYIINHKEQHNIWQGKTSYKKAEESKQFFAKG